MSLQATEEDARRVGLDARLNLKRWDPREEPIVLLGTVFDGRSLGKWIREWTQYCAGEGMPLTGMSEDLERLLEGMLSRSGDARYVLNLPLSEMEREMLEDFVESSGRVLDKMQKVVRRCEDPMLAVGEGGRRKRSRRGLSMKRKLEPQAGEVFVYCLFGVDGMLEETRAVMQQIRLWEKRFDVNCEGIVRKAVEIEEAFRYEYESKTRSAGREEMEDEHDCECRYCGRTWNFMG